MADVNTPIKNTAFEFIIGLRAQSDTKLFQSNPTLAAGDVKVSTDFGAFANITTLPDVAPDSSKAVKVSLSASEMNGDNVCVVFSDAAGAEWCDYVINIRPTARGLKDLAFPTVTGRSIDVTANGNVGIDWGNIDNPSTAQALSATEISSKLFLQTMDIIESQRGGHTWRGNVYYVSPNLGNDTTGNGSRLLPYATVTKALTAVTDSNHDIIFLVPDASPGPTTLTENVTISKRYVFIRGPGRDFIWTRSGAGNTITVNADGVELSGFRVNTAVTGSGYGIHITGADFCKVRKVWCENTRGDAIHIDDSANVIIEDNTLELSGQSGNGHGITVDASNGNSSYCRILHNNIMDVAGDGIRLIDTGGSGTIENIVVMGNVIHGSSEFGINISGTDVVDAMIIDNRLGNNDSGNISNTGVNTILVNNEQWYSNETGGSHYNEILAIVEDIQSDVDFTVIPGLSSISTDTFTIIENQAFADDDLADILSRLPATLDAGNMRANINAITNAIFTDMVMHDSYANRLADHFIRRQLANVAASSYGDALHKRSILGAIRKLVNKLYREDGTGDLVVTAEDDTTEFFRQTVGTDASGEPIKSLDTQ